MESGYRLWQNYAMEKDQQTTPAPAGTSSDEAAAEPDKKTPDRPREIGGRDGPDPTRYGDWEKAGRCIDF